MLFEILDKLFFVVIETDFPDLLFQLSSSTFSQLCLKLATFSTTLINVEYNLEIICLHQHWQWTIAQILRVKASIIRPDFLSNQMHTHAYTHTHARTPHVFVNRAQNSCNLPEINWILDHLHFYIVYQQKMEIASLLMWKKRERQRGRESEHFGWTANPNFNTRSSHSPYNAAADPLRWKLICRSKLQAAVKDSYWCLGPLQFLIWVGIMIW